MTDWEITPKIYPPVTNSPLHLLMKDETKGIVGLVRMSMNFLIQDKKYPMFETIIYKDRKAGTYHAITFTDGRPVELSFIVSILTRQVKSFGIQSSTVPNVDWEEIKKQVCAEAI